MGFHFAWLCDLLEELDQNSHVQRLTYSKHENPSNCIVLNWYDQHNDKICRKGQSAVAFLSCLLPERRPDRTYNLQQKRLTQIFGRVLGLGTSRLKVLDSWHQKDGQDFPSCLERVMAETEFDEPEHPVTLDEIDAALTRIAANNIASAPSIRAQANGDAPINIMAPVIRRLRGYQAKWLVRMIFKSYSPIEIPEYTALHNFHFLLPKLLVMQNSFDAAIDIVSRPELIRLPPRPSKEYEAALLPILVKEIKPRLGMMIRRQPFDKARSIRHCVKLASSRTMSVERKYDGEYCQIHIDNSTGQGAIQIFSKSGKDSTQDRIGLHSAIKAGLKLKTPECKIKRQAILEGELLIYGQDESDILPFYHIRKHVRHGGRRIGTELDSPKKSSDRLMIVFFDILVLDDKVMLAEPHRVRRAHLKGMVTPMDGQVQVVERVMIDFKASDASDSLRQNFSHAIRMRWEGFVLKGVEDPYYSWKDGIRGIKLKKDYIAGLGDSADLCIIGGHRDAKLETKLGLGTLSWTTFYVACLTNKPDVQRFGTRPTFKIVDRIGQGSMSNDDILTLNMEGQLVAREFVANSEYMLVTNARTDIGTPNALYAKPMVVEIFGAGFERPQTADFYILRFPRRAGSRIKIHKDRGVTDTVDFDELQQMAEVSLKEQGDAATQEEVEWMERLLAADPKSRYINELSQSTSPSKTQHSATTASLTPIGQRWTSTQSAVGVNAEKAAFTESNERFSDSAPQTPNRHSDSITSPVSIRTPEVSRRDFASFETSPTHSARKRKRVGFELNRGPNLRTMSDMTSMATGTARQGHERRGREKDGDMNTKTGVFLEPARTLARTNTLPPDSCLTLTRPDNTTPALALVAPLISTPPTAKPPSTTNSIPPIRNEQTPLLTPTLTPTSTLTLPHPRPGHLPPSISPALTVPTHPILLTSSIPTNTTTNLITLFTASNLPYTTSNTTFLTSLLHPPRSPTTTTTSTSTSSNLYPTPNAHPIILIDLTTPTHAPLSIRALLDKISYPIHTCKPTRDTPLTSDILLFDHRVAQTAYWAGLLRTINPKNPGQDGTLNECEGEDEEEEEGYGKMEGEEDWKGYFCGMLRICMSIVDGVDGGPNEYEITGQMIWY